MKQNQFYVGSLLVVALTVAGCQPKTGASVASEATVEIGPKYSAKDGLLIPEDTRRSLGLKTVEVTEQKIQMMLELPLRVYQTSETACLASGSATLDQVKTLKVGQSVQAITGRNQKLAAKITRISEELKEATGMAEVLVEFTDNPDALSVGSFLTGNVSLGAEENVVSIPRAALLEASDGYSVYTVSGEGFVRTPIKVGAMNGELIEIKDGLYAGDQVVLQPVMSLWLTELAAIKGGQACCAVPAKGK